jgi:transposase-like protein
MRERSESGLNVRDFCRQVGIHENTYYHWQRKLRESSVQDHSLPEPKQLLVPSGWAAVEEAVVPVAAQPKSLPIEIGKFRVTVDAETDAELLSRTLKVLAALC